MRNIIKKSVRLFLILIFSLSINLVYFVFSGQNKVVGKIKKGMALSLYDKACIYQMHIAVWSLGWPLAPEAAIEACLMHKKHDKPVVLHSSFLRKAKPETWTGCYDTFSKKLRYALALNGVDFRYENNDFGTTCSLSVEYTNSVRSILGIPINTCMFKYLQEIGWLYPYKIIWIDEKE